MTMNIEIRREQFSDYRETEIMTREAFWNHFVPGCGEHYLLHIMRSSQVFIPELDFVAVDSGKIVGNSVCIKTSIEADDGKCYGVIGLGPISVLPGYQRKGIGRKLIERTKQIAREMGYHAIFLFGDPDYYSRLGFIPAERLSIRTADNMYAAAHQVYELYENALNGITGRYIEDKVYEIDMNEVEEFDKGFSPKEKLSGTQSQKRFEKIVAMRKEAKIPTNFTEKELFTAASKLFDVANGFDSTKKRHQSIREQAYDVRRKGLWGLEPRGLFMLCDRDFILHKITSPIIEHSPEIKKMYAYIFTVGECKVERNDSMSEQLFADMWGTAYAEAARIHLENELRKKLPDGLFLSDTMAPGYYGIPVTDSKPINDILGGENLGIHVLDTGTITPQKSCSGICLIAESDSFFPASTCEDCTPTKDGCRLCEKRLT